MLAKNGAQEKVERLKENTMHMMFLGLVREDNAERHKTDLITMVP